MNAYERAVLDTLRRSKKPLSTKEIADHTEISWSRAKATLLSLHEQKLIEWNKTKNRHQWKYIENDKMFQLADIKISKEKVEKIPEKTIKATGTAIKYSLVLVLIYIIISTALIIYANQQQFLENIVLWSIGGFWAFFMGYWGWMFADQISKSFIKKIKKTKDD